MKNLEPRITGKGLWWDGSYGGVAKYGRFAMLYRKPPLPFIGVYDAIACFPLEPGNKGLNYVVHNGVTHDLSEDESAYISASIDTLFPDQGGGGGGGDTRAIIAVDASSADPMVRLTRADGSTVEANFGNTIQNTPAYDLLVNNQGYNRSAHCNMVAGDGDKNGVKCPGKDMPMSVPVWMYDYKGSKRDGDYDQTTGDIYVNAESVEGTWQMAFHVGVHPDWPKMSQGRPVGRYAMVVHFEQKQPDGSYVEISRKEHQFTTHTGSYPNTGTLNFSTTSFTHITAGMSSGWYRLRFSVSDFGNDPDVYQWVRFMAVSDGWLSNSSANHYFQLRGSIKASAGGTTINPIPRP